MELLHHHPWHPHRLLLPLLFETGDNRPVRRAPQQHPLKRVVVYWKLSSRPIEAAFCILIPCSLYHLPLGRGAVYHRFRSKSRNNVSSQPPNAWGIRLLRDDEIDATDGIIPWKCNQYPRMTIWTGRMPKLYLHHPRHRGWPRRLETWEQCLA
jgi:hypothetical protein